MSLDLEPAPEPVTSAEQLVAYFRAAERSRDQLRIGLEHEKLVYFRGDARPVPYEGEHGIAALFERLTAEGHGRFREAPHLPVIALTRGPATISLEPGGQLELSGSPARTAREVHQENLRHLDELRAAAGPLDVQFVALGYRPYDRVDQVPWMPKSRYKVMRQTLSARGELALNMMLMTATAQVSLDWRDEADCARKVVTAARVTPLLVALYANSPLEHGRPNGFASYRSHVWTKVDPARCGYLPAMFDGSFGYRAYVEWAMDAPLLFLRRRGEYLTPKMTFRQLLRDGFEGQPALASDWVDHLSTMFPEVRIKRVMEIRGCDCCSLQMTGALAALARGLFYDDQALEAASSLLPRLSLAEHLALHDAARRSGLRATFRGHRLADWAKELVAIARAGLERLDREDVPLLEPLAEIAAAGRSPFERVLELHERAKSPAELLSAFAL